jgi:enamine deaminase RidA (YjgF/YER057c/UK114 family)
VIKKVISAKKYLNAPIDYGKSFSRGLKLDFNGFSMLFISGTASIGSKGQTLFPGDFSKQVRRTFANLAALLASEGCSWKDVVQTRCYLKDMRHYHAFNVCRNKFYRSKKLKIFPASACVQANLCRPELLVEIEVTAVTKTTHSGKK